MGRFLNNKQDIYKMFVLWNGITRQEHGFAVGQNEQAKYFYETWIFTANQTLCNCKRG
jgi:hypothetical protein